MENRIRWMQERQRQQRTQEEDFIAFSEPEDPPKDTQNHSQNHNHHHHHHHHHHGHQHQFSHKHGHGRDQPPHSKQLKRVKENDEMDYNEEVKYAPWMTKSTAMIRNPNVRFHNEVIELTHYLMPKEDDLSKRNLAINQLVRIIKVEMPNVEIKPFGSFSTKLYLPNADIDLVSHFLIFGFIRRSRSRSCLFFCSVAVERVC